MSRAAYRAALLLLMVAPAVAQERPVAFTNARIIPIAGPEIERGTLVVHLGKIVAVGPVDAVPVPPDADRRDAAGKTIMPGLVDTHSHLGGPWAADGSAPIQPDVRAVDSVNVRDAGFRKARAGGITTANIMSGSGHLLSGQTVYMKLRDGRTVDDLVVRNADGSIAGGIKMANGTNSIRPAGAGPFPGTRAKSAALVREQFVKAREYRDKVQKAAGDPAKLPPRDLGLEVLVDVLDGKRVVHHHTHRHDDILTVLRLQKEFGFKVVLHHVSEAWKVAPQIAEAKAPCSVIVVDSPGGKPEARDLSFETGKVLDEAGVLVGFHSDDPITDSRLFLRSAALAVRAGMKRDRALYAMTMAGAIMLDLHDRVGTLEPGKDADVVVLSGDPLSVYTHVLETWVEGNRVFDRSDPADRLFATGGFGAGRERAFFTECCLGAGAQ
jgi:imidazolonepropionase-like amidohydrolase